jgi:hypothetical protein
VVCDLNKFEIHTNFTGTATRVYGFDLDGLADPGNLDVLRKVFTDPEALKPGETREGITKEAANRFSHLAEGMRHRGVPARSAAHFLMKMVDPRRGQAGDAKGNSRAAAVHRYAAGREASDFRVDQAGRAAVGRESGSGPHWGSLFWRVALAPA